MHYAMEEAARRSIKQDAVAIEKTAVLKYITRPGYDAYIQNMSQRIEEQIQREILGGNTDIQDKFEKYRSLASSFKSQMIAEGHNPNEEMKDEEEQKGGDA